ncbi:TerB N-terminal domain-containing protein [Paenibacillus glacialis]|uniref:TerB-C domain-containing protein n=1 Tax=Paenibacillus glacialis TaxID=494026 RepID=A0A162KEE6_9BACL|nr:TerB N-terminal domain-containing protein [Paenibacillus glacialis]OAB45328.1 hypothetical protein PGLA_03495 [Paenibacillus glacialis]
MTGERENGNLTDIRISETYQEAELVLEGYTEVNNGVGQAYAIPVLMVDSQRLKAAEVSRSIKPDGSLVPVLDGYISVDTLRQAGVGPMGRTIHGAVMDRPYQLIALEIIARGSERMQGAWNRVIFPELDWPYAGEYPVYEHLQFLAKWGLNGGARGGAFNHAEEIRLFMNDTLQRYPETKILVVGKKVLLDKLRESWVELDAMWLTAGGKQQMFQEILPSGIIIATPNVAKQHQVQTMSFDIILMLEPDDLTKSSTTQIYKQLKKMKSRLKLAVYAKEDYIAQSYVSTTHMNLLKINDYSVSQYVIYNPKNPRKELPRPYRRLVRPSILAESPSLHMTEMELEGERGEKGTPIPRREEGGQFIPSSLTASFLPERHAKQAEGTSFSSEGEGIPASASGGELRSPFDLKLHAEIESLFPLQPRSARGHDSSITSVPAGSIYELSEHRFTKRARLYEERIESSAVFVPFMNYWPTYDSMTNSQSMWYFYWRGEVRSQRYQGTDLSYIFLYVYELINGIGWREPIEGYQMMVDVWMAYREQYSKLTSYILEWMTDFALVHQLPISLHDVFRYAPNELTGDLLEMELMHRFRTEPLDMPLSLLMRLSDVDVSKSKFYTEGGELSMKEYVPKVFALVDAYLAKQQGLRLIEMFYPGPILQKERPLFQGAMYDESQYGRSIIISISKISAHPPLREFATQLIRLTENKLRENLNFKGRLRGIELEPEIETLVSRYIDRMFTSTSVQERRGPAVVIDEEKLAQLQQDSEFVRDILTVNIEEETDLVIHSNHKGSEWTGYGDASADDVKDKVEMEDELELKVEIEVQVQGEVDVEARTAFAEQQVSLLHHDINILKESDGKPSKSLITWDVTGLPEEWKEFVNALSAIQLESIYILKEGQDLSGLQDIANEAGTMPELLLDDINMIAMDTLGDLIIDGAELTEEYLPMLAQLNKTI